MVACLHFHSKETSMPRCSWISAWDMQYSNIIVFVWLSLPFFVVCFELLPPRIHLHAAKPSITRSLSLLLHAANDGDEATRVSSSSSSSLSTATSLYQTIPSNKPWTFGMLTSGFPPQQLLVPIVKFVTFQVWRLMMNELVTHDEQGRFIRESFQVGNNPVPLSLPSESVPRYKVYLGNPCPWCHRVKAAMALLELEHDIPITMLIDNAEKASKGGWILPDPTPSDTNLPKELTVGDLASVYNYCYRDVLQEGERYNGRCTAPLLVDVSSGKIVSNESNEIMVLLNDFARRRRGSGSDSSTEQGLDLRPVGMEDGLDRATKHWFDSLWNASYRCGFATSQLAYDEVRPNNMNSQNHSLHYCFFSIITTQIHVTSHSIKLCHSCLGSFRCSSRIEWIESTSCHFFLPSGQFTNRGRSQEFCMGHTTWLCLHRHLQITRG